MVSVDGVPPEPGTVTNMLTGTVFGAMVQANSIAGGVHIHSSGTPGLRGVAGPEDRSWIAAVHVSAHDYAPVGAGVVLDRFRVLTSGQVITLDGKARSKLWVAFPLSESPLVPRVRVERVRRASGEIADLAVLELASPVPAGVTTAPLRCPSPSALEGRCWWTFGFPQRRAKGTAATGSVGAHSGYGWVHVKAGSPLTDGFRGAGLWCPDYEAVVGIIGEADERGEGQAITLHHADRHLPDDRIEVLTRWTIEAGDDVARQTWNWKPTGDGEVDRHWRPRARGVTSNAEQGDRFQGRVAALRTITAWLDRPTPDHRVLVVTGEPGAGKSAVLGRVVVTAHPTGDDTAADSGPRASPGSVGCAVHAKGKTALEVAREIARAGSASIPERAGDLPAALLAALVTRPGTRFNLVVDALDEATDSAQVRAIAQEVLMPIATDCAQAGAQVVVGTRRSDGDHDLLRLFAPGLEVIDLDQSAYFAVDDLVAYAKATLQLRGAERLGNPYRSDDLAGPVASRIAQLAGRNFLVAGLVARTHGLYDTTPVPVGRIRFTTRVEDALNDFLRRIPAVDGVSAADLLTALAYVEAPGVSVPLWQAAVCALTDRTVSERRLREFARTSAADFLVRTTGPSSGTAGSTYRLFHQALNDTLSRRSIADEDGEVVITKAFIAFGSQHGWSDAPAYLLRALPDHAARTGLIDTLLTDAGYTLHADLRRLIAAGATATTRAGTLALRLLRRTSEAIDADPERRLALFSVTEALDTPGSNTYRRQSGAAPYLAVWAHSAPRTEHAILTVDPERADEVCVVPVAGRDLLAVAGANGALSIWDPATGARLRQLTERGRRLSQLCVVRVGDRDLLVARSENHVVQVWDPADGTRLHRLAGREDWSDVVYGPQVDGRVHDVCAVRVAGRDLLAVAAERVVWLWDPARSAEPRELIVFDTLV
jgi:hypothetical protein